MPLNAVAGSTPSCEFDQDTKDEMLKSGTVSWYKPSAHAYNVLHTGEFGGVGSYVCVAGKTPVSMSFENFPLLA